MRVTPLKSGTQFSFDLLAGALTGRDAARATGTLHVLGNPGGRIHLRAGGIICAESPGSPGLDALLTTGARGTIGDTELNVVAMMATQDAAFTIVAGDIQDCVFTSEAVEVAVPLSTAIDPVRLLQETSRRMTSLLALKCPLSPHHDRVGPARGAGVRDLGPVRGEILAHATGRRTTRDIAFASGRSVFPVTVEACRMVADGLLTVIPPTGHESDDVPLPRSLRRQLLPKLFKQPEKNKS
jgi:hypothetical protein